MLRLLITLVGTEKVTIAEPIYFLANVSNSTACADVDHSLCQKLKYDHPDICLKDCIAKHMCPNTCSKCGKWFASCVV